MKKFLLFVPVICVFIFSIVMGYNSYKKESQKWDAENKCIAEYINERFERSEIIRDNGSCYVK